MECPSCGSTNEATASVCAACSAPLSAGIPVFKHFRPAVSGSPHPSTSAVPPPDPPAAAQVLEDQEGPFSQIAAPVQQSQTVPPPAQPVQGRQTAPAPVPFVQGQQPIQPPAALPVEIEPKPAATVPQPAQASPTAEQPSISPTDQSVESRPSASPQTVQPADQIQAVQPAQPGPPIAAPPAPPPPSERLPYAPEQVAQPGQVVLVPVVSRGPNLLWRGVWYIFIGWWLGGLAIYVAWFFNLSIIGLPVGLYILNRIPQLMTLRPEDTSYTLESKDGIVIAREVDREQMNFWLRAVYFVLVGWWFSLIWLSLAWVSGVSLILLPLTFWMFSKSAFVTTLRLT